MLPLVITGSGGRLSWFSFLLLDSAKKVSISFLLIEYLSSSSKYKSVLVRQLCLGFHFFYVSLQASFNLKIFPVKCVSDSGLTMAL